MYRVGVCLPAVIFRALVRVVTTTHDLVPLVLAVVDLVVAVVSLAFDIQNLLLESITIFPGLPIFLEAHARVVAIVLAPCDAFVRSDIRLVVALAPVRAIPVHAVQLVASRGR